MEILKSKDVAKATGLSPLNIREICLRRKLPKTKNHYIFPADVWRGILLKKHLKKFNRVYPHNRPINKKFPEVIYVHTTWTILESKLNFK